MKAETRFIRQIQKMANDKEFQNKHVTNAAKDFKRTRKLTFSDVIMYTIGNTRSPLELEAKRFSKHLTTDEISGAALCKSRQKIKYTAYEELFKQTAVTSPRDKRFHGYHLYAVDGMKGELPKTPELSTKYCESEKCRTPVFHAVSAFDVLNELFIRSEFHFGAADERALAGKMIDDVIQDVHYKYEPQIWIFDRGFPSLSLIQKLLEHQLYFVMRVSSSFLKEVNEFRKSKYVDRQIHIEYSAKRAAANHVNSNGINEFDLRCVRIKLPNGKDEILITNLERKKFPKRDIKEIYRLRWGIETSFNYLKNAAFVEEFVSRTENGIAQDYYVSLLVYNFTTCICGSMYPDIPKKENTSTRLTVELPPD